MIQLFLLFLCLAQTNIFTDGNVRLHGLVPSYLLALDTPLTIGTPLAVGDVPAGARIEIYIPTPGATLTTQTNCLSVHESDGSCRHALVTATIPKNTMTASSVIFMQLVRVTTSEPAAKNKADAMARLANLQASATVTLAGVSSTAGGAAGTYFVDLIALLSTPAASVRLAGPKMVELVARAAPKHTTTQTAHAWLEIEVSVRVFFEADFFQVDLAVENTKATTTTGPIVHGWSVTNEDRLVTYAATVSVSTPLYALTDYVTPTLQHWWSQRWRYLALWPVNAEQIDNVFFFEHNMRYWSYSRAIPSYDYVNKQKQTAAQIDGDYNNFLAKDNGALGISVVTKYMPQTGGRDDIGVFPEWTAKYFFSPESWKLQRIVLFAGNAGGSWPVHWRNQSSTTTNPFFSIESDKEVSHNQGAYGHHIIQRNPYPSPPTLPTPDCPHQPSLAFVPYLLTGAYYYLNEMVYWPTWALARTNPGNYVPNASYRQKEIGIVVETARGNAWCYRQLVHAQYFLPTGHPMKQEIGNWARNTMTRWAGYAPISNNLGYFTVDGEGGAQSYKYDPEMSSDVEIYTSPWQHDFLVSVAAYTSFIDASGGAGSFLQKYVEFINFVGNWTVNRFHSKHAAVFDRSYGAPYHLARSSYTNYFYQTMAEMWFYSYAGDNLKPIDGLGNCGPTNPTNCGLCYPYISRGTLRMLKAVGMPDSADPEAYLTSNLAWVHSAYKWAFDNTLQGQLYSGGTMVPSPSPTLPTMQPSPFPTTATGAPTTAPPTAEPTTSPPPTPAPPTTASATSSPTAQPVVGNGQTTTTTAAGGQVDTLSGEEGGSSALLWAIIAVAAVVAIICVAALVVFFMRQRSATVTAAMLASDKRRSSGTRHSRHSRRSSQMQSPVFGASLGGGRSSRRDSARSDDTYYQALPRGRMQQMSPTPY